MRVCDICPGGAACAGINLAPVLVRVFDLYAGQCRIPRAVRDTIYRRYVVHLIDSAATAPNYIQHALFAQRWTLRLLLIELKRTLQGISNFYVAPR